VPNLQDRQTEEEHLRQAALQPDGPVILTMPSMRGMCLPKIDLILLA
jgi:hypothetical protein